MYHPQSYSLQDFGDMFSSSLRMAAYQSALQSAVRPGDVVVDLGCGTGIFTLLACQYGARRVYAIEPGDAVLVAQEIARENGFSDCITFIQDVSSAVTLPERANLIVSDLRSVLPLFQQHIPSIVDARKRFLKAGGVLIPKRDILYAAVVENAAQYQRMMASWLEPPYSLSMMATRGYLTNSWEKAKLDPGNLLSGPQVWAELDYTTIAAPDVRAELTAVILRPGDAHGLALWFDAELVDGIGFSNAPGAPPLIYGQAFFPFPQPVEVQAGDLFHVQLRADLIGGDYTWSWKTQTMPGGRPGAVGLSFEQSTVFSTPVSLARLKKSAASYSPSLDQEGLAERFMLDRMDGSTPLSDIAQAALERFPELFPTWKAALSRAGELSAKYALEAPAQDQP